MVQSIAEGLWHYASEVAVERDSSFIVTIEHSVVDSAIIGGIELYERIF